MTDKSLRTHSNLAALFQHDGWTTESPRDEIRPAFHFDPNGGRDGKGGYIIEADRREGLDGWWSKSLPVKGGSYYRFSAQYRGRNITLPRACVMAKLDWYDAKGQPVPEDRPTVTGYLFGYENLAETEHPATRNVDAKGWTEIADTYRAPAGATQAIVELHLQWSPNSRVEWSQVGLTETPPLPRRIVRLAAAHFRPNGGTSGLDKCALYEPVIADSSRQRADLIVLGETLTYYGLGKSMVECAEPIPGPSTDYFGALARKHGLYIVAGLIERAGHLVYNTAALIDPDGHVAGTYRKATLPRSEVKRGIAPGTDYPVFDTKFGKVGIMICYDGFFPEVARELTNRGAEVIAWPVWGCNPLLAAARACENLFTSSAIWRASLHG